MTRRALVTVTLSLLVPAVAGCGVAARSAPPAVEVGETPAATGPVQLAAFEDGVGAVADGRSAPVWHEPGSVAALDGSAVFSIRAGGAASSDLVRIDPRTGAVLSTRTVPAGLTIAAIAPEGAWVAMTDRAAGYGNQNRATTKLLVSDTNTNTITRILSLDGDIQPEAFSVDGTSVFALHYATDHYRVQTIELASGLVADTIDRDKLPFEDMRGHAIHGVMSTDRTLLATLYRDPVDADHPAFVHVLDLRGGWSYCADLPEPFGTGAPGSDAIRLAADNVVEVAAIQANRLAAIPIAPVHTYGSPVAITYRTGTITPPPASIASLPGFEYVIGSLPG